MKASESELTQEELKRVLHYDPETGVFRWRISPRKGVRPWTTAGSRHKGGYIQLAVNKVNYLAHRLAWLYMTGSFPKEQIDHINRCKTDNRFDNLRDVSPRINSQNQREARSDSTSGLLGVSWHASRKKWVAQIRVKSERLFLGRFDDKELAHAAYLKAKREVHEGNTI